MSARGVSAVGVLSAHGGGICPRGVCWGCLPGGCVYPSMHWAGECLSRGVYPSMHWGRGCLPRGVSAQGVSAGAVSAGGGVYLEVPLSQHALGRGCLLGDVCLPRRGCLSAQKGVSAWGGVCWGLSAWGVYPSMHGAGGCLPWGVSVRGGCVSQYALGRGVCIPACTGHRTESSTYACENITFPQLRCGR